MSLLRRTFLLALVVVVLIGLLQSCSVLFTYPNSISQAERFSAIPAHNAPIKNEIKIHWDKFAIPFVEANNTGDLAFGVGVVHAHLRLGQLELFRYISQGRLSELAGPIPQVKTVDQGLRMINFCRSGQASIEKMSTESRTWLKGFQRGVNWVVENLETKPAEHRFFDIEPTPFTENDLMCIARLVSADLTWITYLQFLKLAEQEGWEEAFRFTMAKRDNDVASYDNSSTLSLSSMLLNFSKSGSNSLVISGNRSNSGSALIASDPHVGLFLPNFWLMVGVSSPEYHAFGLMIPGVPVIGVGRNNDIAWGGTNMRGISSHLIDISNLPEDQITSRSEHLARRWWADTEITIRETQYGTVITDSAFFDPEKQPFSVALDWIGNEGSDEIGAFLKVAQAKDWASFRNAFEGYQVSAMNMLYADKAGNIGMVPAYGQPVLRDPQKTLELVKSDNNAIVNVLKPTEQPNPFNPAQGFIASANNKPFSNPKIPYGFSFANNDRVERLADLVGNKPNISVNELMDIQLDVHSESAFSIIQYLVSQFRDSQVKENSKVFDHLAQWDGKFNYQSPHAVACEVIMYFAWQDYVAQQANNDIMAELLQRYSNWKPELLSWLKSLPKQELTLRFQQWLAQSEEHVLTYPTWGDFHQQPQVPVIGSIPVIGSRFSLPSYPASGSNDTLLKAGRAFSPEKAEVTYGSSARHISDMSSLDENYFVLHGGQDGWLMSPNLADQTELWRNGEYIKIPLSSDGIKHHFNQHTTVINPN